MKINNPALIEYFGTDTLTADMKIDTLQIGLNLNYDFDEIREIQKMFNIANIDIKESVIYDDFGTNEDEFNPFGQDIDMAVLGILNELNPDGIKNIQFCWNNDEFNTKNLGKFKELEKASLYNGEQYRDVGIPIMKIKNPALIKYFGTDTLTSDMSITKLELVSDQDYDFEEIQSLQEKINISTISIVEGYSDYDDFGMDEEEFDPFDNGINREENNNTNILRMLNELNPNNIKKMELYWEGNEFDLEHLEKFEGLETVSLYDSKSLYKSNDTREIKLPAVQIKNPALIEYFGTDMLTADMKIDTLQLGVNLGYDFDEIRKIQKKFNITNIDIKKNVPYDDFGMDIEEFNPFEQDDDIAVLEILSELNPDGIKNIQFCWNDDKFNTKALGKFKEVEIASIIDDQGNKSLDLDFQNREIKKYTGQKDILSQTLRLNSDEQEIDFNNFNSEKLVLSKSVQNIKEVFSQIKDINTVEEIEVSENITISDIEFLQEQNIRVVSDKPLKLIINNVSELSSEKLKDLSSNIPIESIQVYSKYNNTKQNTPYDIDTYSAISDELSQMVEGIDDNLPEKEKFAEIYRRVTTSIAYDTPAGYPETPEEEQYKKDMVTDCRNLKNGVLYKKCVCAGYADILRNALALKGIDSIYVHGPIDEEVDISLLETPKYKDEYVYSRDEENGKAIIRSYHAWNKVKLDGKWYHTDPTWDRDELLEDDIPKYCLKSDEEYKKIGRTEFDGPECPESMNQDDLKDAFYGKHIRIGKFEVPNLRDCKKYIKECIDESIDEVKNLPKDIKNGFQTFSSKLKNIFNRTKTLGAGNSKNSEIIKTQEKPEDSHSWDLENWGTDMKEFSKQRSETISEFSKKSEEKNNSEQEKNTQMDERE